MRVFRLFIPVLILPIIFLVGCSSTDLKPTLDQGMLSTDTPMLPVPSTPTQRSTQTPRPSMTPASTFTLEATATPTMTPDSSLAEIELIGLAWLSNYNMLLSFQFPGHVDPLSYRVTLEDKEFSCEVISTHLDRIYCYGPGTRVLATAWVRVFSAGALEPGFEKQVWVPYFDNNYDTFAP